MSTLFDISPSEPGRKKTSRRKQEAVAATASSSAATVVPTAAAAPAIGRLDQGVECVDQECQGTVHDILEEGQHDLTGLGAAEPAWRVECVFCGCAQWTRPIKGHLKPVENVFLFRDGLFAGMTPAQAALQPRGQAYLEWAAESHPRPSVRAAVKKYLDRAVAGR